MQVQKDIILVKLDNTSKSIPCILGGFFMGNSDKFDKPIIFIFCEHKTFLALQKKSRVEEGGYCYTINWRRRKEANFGFSYWGSLNIPVVLISSGGHFDYLEAK